MKKADRRTVRHHFDKWYGNFSYLKVALPLLHQLRGCFRAGVNAGRLIERERNRQTIEVLHERIERLSGRE